MNEANEKNNKIFLSIFEIFSWVRTGDWQKIFGRKRKDQDSSNSIRPLFYLSGWIIIGPSLTVNRHWCEKLFSSLFFKRKFFNNLPNVSSEIWHLYSETMLKKSYLKKIIIFRRKPWGVFVLPLDFWLEREKFSQQKFSKFFWYNSQQFSRINFFSHLFTIKPQMNFRCHYNLSLLPEQREPQTLTKKFSDWIEKFKGSGFFVFLFSTRFITTISESFFQYTHKSQIPKHERKSYSTFNQRRFRWHMRYGCQPHPPKRRAFPCWNYRPNQTSIWRN